MQKYKAKTDLIVGLSESDQSGLVAAGDPVNLNPEAAATKNWLKSGAIVSATIVTKAKTKAKVRK